MELSILVNFVEDLMLKILKIWEHSKLQKKKLHQQVFVASKQHSQNKKLQLEFFISAFIDKIFKIFYNLTNKQKNNDEFTKK